MHDDALLHDRYVPAAALTNERCGARRISAVPAAAARGFVERRLALGEAVPRPAVRRIVNEELAKQEVWLS